jgi:beta-galactosidase
MTMPSITFNTDSYFIDGCPGHLYSGEFHYFRVPRSDWRKRMRLFREAGGNCLATYIPWLLHEPVEGDFRFGSPDGVLNLDEFLVTAREEGFAVIARPGPYQYSELVYSGLPAWICRNYPALRARHFDGKDFTLGSISYLHPLFLEKVATWFDAACKILAPHLASNGGPVEMVQVDNELGGIHRWMGGYDYNPETMGFGREDGLFARFLKARHPHLDDLNRLWGTAYASFAEARPPAPGPGTTADLPRLRQAQDYSDFYYWTLGEYVGRLSDMLRANGITCPLVTNSPNPQSNLWFLETVKKAEPGFLLGSDHYYNLGPGWPRNNPTPQYAREIFFSMETLRLMGFPPTVFELPGGSCADWPPLEPHDAKACYWANLALGMKGCNVYIFTGGPNPPGAGSITEIYDYNAAIGAAGDIRPIYRVIREFGQFLQTHDWLAGAQREHDCRFALDMAMMRRSEVWKEFAGTTVSPETAWDFLMKGPLTSAFCAGLSPKCVDVGSEDWVADTATPLVIVTSSAMSAACQERIVRFLANGGQALIAPVIPVLDDNLEPCSILADGLGTAVQSRNAPHLARTRVTLEDEILYNVGTFAFPQLPGDAEVLGHTEQSEPVAWRRRFKGGGECIMLGLYYIHAMREQQRMLSKLLGRLGLRPKVTVSNPNIWPSLLTSGKRSLLFLMNLNSSPMDGTVRCRPEWAEDGIDLGRQTLGPMEVRVVELEYESRPSVI